MAETVAKERWEVAISGKGRLAPEELAKEGRVNVRIHCRSTEEVRLIRFYYGVVVSSFPP